jgi:hypothetical protein
MSVADVYATHEELMDLKLNPNNEDQLIHPYNQVRSIPNSNRREIKIYNFANGNWDKRNQLNIPTMDLRITEMYVEFTLSAEASQSDARWEPTPTWLTLQGVDLQYKNQSVINMSEPEALMATLLDERENIFDSKNRLYAFQTIDSATVATKLYLPINHICDQVLSKVGSISAYSSGDWSITVDLRPQLACLSAASNITAPTSEMLVMRLICVGNKVPVGEVLMQRKALLENGIVFNYLKSNRFREELGIIASGASASWTRVFNSVVGNLSHVRMVHRDKDQYNSLGTTSKNNVRYQNGEYYGVASALEVGRIARPYDIFGQPVYTPFVSTFFAKQNMGQNRYIGLLSDPTTIADVAIDTGILDISFAESVCDMANGTSTGSYPVKNDFRIKYTVNNIITADETDIEEAYHDIIIYQHVRGILTAKNVNIMGSA